MSNLRSTFTGALAAAVAISLVASAPAEARRGGSFGSRGARTYSAPRPTTTAPGYTAPVQRSMTPPGVNPGANPGASPYGAQPARPSYAPGQTGAFQQRRPGFGTGIMAGLIGGGLLGAMLGHGFGGGWGSGMGGGMGGGLMATLFQLLVIGGLIWLALRLFRRRQDTPAMAGGPFGAAYDPAPQPGAGPWGLGGGLRGGSQPQSQPYPSPADEIAVSSADRAAFERLLMEVQDAFAHEDYGALRERTTPEVMSYLAEELSQNATHDRRNDVSRTRLLQSDVSEAWSEGEADYATVAMRYESIDLMRDRKTGQVVEGDPNRPTTTTELWTFVRRNGGPWKLSAIQET